MTQALRSLTDLTSLDRETLVELLDSAERFLAPEAATAHRKLLAGEAVALLFFEPSTRTRFSFELAARRVGADVIALHESTSSQTKGETLSDTLSTLAAMGARHFVVRHRENGIMATLAANLPPGTTLINAGEGTRAHPTQGLLDAFTIRRHRPEIERLTVTIVGDIAHSRVARSTLSALKGLGVGALHLVGPAEFLSAPGELPGVATTDLAAGLDGADVVMALRIQHERLGEGQTTDPETYRKRYGLTIERLERYAKPDVLLMHPGPTNWGVELAPELAHWPRSLIREQVRNGVAVRMAMFARLSAELHNHV
ncbi:MAG: aspartate carbamoyltransferase catalytic subunit [Gammaproteobacteria bacterium]